jgi:hypothetical protein
MFNPPAALQATRLMTGDAAPQRRAARPTHVLDDPWLDPLAAAPAVKPASRRARRRVSWRVISSRA